MPILTFKHIKKWKRRDIILLLERLELYLSSGLTLDKALSILEESIPPQLKKSIQTVHREVTSGYALSQSLHTHIRISKNISGLLEHGEHSGELAGSISLAHKLLEKEDELYKKSISALAYPIIIALFATLLTIGLVRGVMPQIIPMLKSLNVELPLLTRVMIFISENMVTYGLYIISGLILGTLIHVFMTRKVTGYLYITQCTLVRIPVIGKLIYSYSLSLFLQSSGTLIQSGMPVAHACVQTSSTVALLPLSRLLEIRLSAITTGVPLGSLIPSDSKYIPSYVPSLLLAGEASGTLGSSLLRASVILDRDMDHTLKRLTALIEPVMMAGMGCVVGAIALSIMMPIYDISKVLQQ